MTYHCRACGTPLDMVFADLGRSPPANAFRTFEQLDEPEYTLPLRVYVCHRCQFVQLPAHESPAAIFNDYAYLSSCAPTWVEHMRQYAAKMTASLKLGAGSLVVDIGSNDGYLLQHFKEFGMPVIGVDPALNVARIAQEKGIPTAVGFFGRKMAEDLVASHRRADLINATNVLAHVPDIHDFIAGFETLLEPEGTIVFEFPHIANLINGVQLDTIYHEHYSYLSLWSLEPVFSAHHLRVYDVDRVPTHGGSLRLYVCHDYAKIRETSAVNDLREAEENVGLRSNNTYIDFANKTEKVKLDLLEFLIKQKRHGKMVVGYGAPAKATTLLNYCGIDEDLIYCTCDASPEKQGKYIPGTRIPIFTEEQLSGYQMDYVLIFPWNLREAITVKAAYLRGRGARFFTAIPSLHILP